jgi:hypothetical protein
VVQVTTKAMAEGAIEGHHTDYKMGSGFSTDFVYTRFDKTAAKPRDVSKLSGKRVGKDSKRHQASGVGANADVMPTAAEVIELMAGSSRRLEQSESLLSWFRKVWHAIVG